MHLVEESAGDEEEEDQDTRECRKLIENMKFILSREEYLFLFSKPLVCHVFISSRNIMLDENFTAKETTLFVGLLNHGVLLVGCVAKGFSILSTTIGLS
ncbi:hypothetical protein RIF29_29779 [Crotalaria pallida]|uniref:Uncharacterized protein n=1 Tax=Crotalaria pallida TaxID=3830 RepID=A0AAN9EF53_CROPI